jgi:hypothetical protein
VRNTWQHSIAPMGVLRYSVTLRTFRPGHGSKEQQASSSRQAPRVPRRGAGKRADDREQ